MRRTPYTQKNTRQNVLQVKTVKGNSETNSFFQKSVLKIEINKINQDALFTSSRTNRYPFTQKQSIKNTYKRPYTTARSNSFSQIKSTFNINEEQDIPKQVRKSSYSITKANTKAKDLWVSTVKEFTQKKSHNYSFESKIQDFHNHRGKLHRGVSFKGDQKSFVKTSHDQTYSSSKTGYSAPKFRQPSEQSFRKTGPITDAVGRNIKKTAISRATENDNFFEYIMRFSYKTKKGYSPSNPHKVNQDAYITQPNINNRTWQHLFGICDGHGPLGHLVSNFIKTHLPKCISTIKNVDKNPVYCLNKSFQNTYQKLVKDSHIDLKFSGSTVIACYFLQNKLYCCNVGDSRAILGKNKCGKKWKAVSLSTDHKPSLPSEAQRIRKMKGRVQAYKDQFGEQIGPLRVWLRNDNVPGLAMTRSFGDLVGVSVGVSHQPQIKQFTLNQQDKIIVLASDGVFQFLDNDLIINEMAQFYEKKQIQQASDHLLTMAHRSWGRNSSIIDDITFILIFLNYNQI